MFQSVSASLNIEFSAPVETWFWAWQLTFLNKHWTHQVVFA